MRFRSMLLLLCVTLAPGNIVFADDESSGFEHHGTNAKPIKRAAPIYPASERRSNNQGWVRLSYVITTDGKVIDPVVEDSSGSRAFEQAALDNVRTWTFEPATWDGTAVEQCNTETMITFAIEDEQAGVTKLFLNRYKKIINHLENGKLDAAKNLINKISDEAQMNVYEISQLWFLKSLYARAKGNEAAQLSYLRKAVANNGRWIDERVYPNLLFTIVVLEIRQRNFSAAIRSYEKLMQQSAEIEYLPQVSNAILTIRNTVASDTAIETLAVLEANAPCDDCVADWHYRPLRRQFTIRNIEGELSSLEIRCAWQRVVDTPRDGVTWNIPEEWGSCRVIVFGDAGTSFSLLELPNQQSGTS